MSKKISGVCGVITFLIGIFLPFMGLEQNKSDILPLLMGIILIILGSAIVIFSINHKVLKYSIMTVCVLFSLTLAGVSYLYTSDAEFTVGYKGCINRS